MRTDEILHHVTFPAAYVESCIFPTDCKFATGLARHPRQAQFSLSLSGALRKQPKP